MRYEGDKGGRPRDPKRDAEILRRILAGLTNEQISKELGIHRNTVSLMRCRLIGVSDARVRDFVRAADALARAEDAVVTAEETLSEAIQERELAQRFFDTERSVLLLQKLAGEHRPASVRATVSADAETRNGTRLGDLLGV